MANPAPTPADSLRWHGTVAPAGLSFCDFTRASSLLDSWGLLSLPLLGQDSAEHNRKGALLFGEQIVRSVRVDQAKVTDRTRFHAVLPLG